MTTKICDRCKKPLEEIEIALRIDKRIDKGDKTLCASCTERLFGFKIVAVGGIDLDSRHYKEFIRELTWKLPGYIVP